MKQILQHQKSGDIEIADVPAPTIAPGWIVVDTRASLISAGTEKASVEKSKSSLLERARRQPDDVRQVVDMVKKEGLKKTLRKVKSTLDSYRTLGYSAAGVVKESACDEFRPGDRVACGGAGYAVHAEVIAVPKNLAVRIPDELDFEKASFATVGSIALQGIRQAGPRIGETVAVIGLGLLGHLTVAMLKANGCRVVGLDIDESQFELARQLGADEVIRSDGDAVSRVTGFSRGLGADAVIITAGTDSNQPMESAISMSRKKGRVVVVGAVGMDLPRSPFYEKELDVTISCSYGPGRYDPAYEEEGLDYPPGFVRWTENRNMEAVLDLVASDSVDITPLISHRFGIDDAVEAYRLITGEKRESYVGIVITYPETNEERFRRTLARSHDSSSTSKPTDLSVGFVGAGSFAQANLLPHLQRLDVSLDTAITSTPANATTVAKQFGFRNAGTDGEETIDSPSTNCIFIATRHDTHGDFVARALEKGKQVFVEKPLAVSRTELDRIGELIQSGKDRLMVGFNRRFSESFRSIRRHFEGTKEPLAILYRVNAGYIPPTHWVQRPDQGGRIIGEGCHFIDVMQYLTDARPIRVRASSIRSENRDVINADTSTVTIEFDDGSVGTLLYIANGAKSVAKEYCEVHGSGKSAIMDDFRRVTLASGTRASLRKFDGSKGHREEVEETIRAMATGSPMPISPQSILDTTLATFDAAEQLGVHTTDTP